MHGRFRDVHLGLRTSCAGATAAGQVFWPTRVQQDSGATRPKSVPERGKLVESGHLTRSSTADRFGA